MRNNLFHRSLLAAVAITAGLAVCGNAEAADKTLTVGKAAPNSDPIIPINVGYKLGIFKKHGLDLKIVNFSGGSKLAQAMAAGSIDIGDGAGTEMAFVAKGVPMKAICETAGPVPFLSIGVPWDSPVHKIEDLKGNKIGVSRSGSLTYWLAKELTRTQGWGPDGVKIVAIGNSVNSVVSAFQAHLVDADVSTTSLFLTMEEKKIGRLLFPVTKNNRKLAAGALFASNHLMETDPDAVRAFLAGWIETVHFIRTHKDETVKIESGITGFSKSVMEKEYDLTTNMFSDDCKFDKESLATLKRSFADLKLLPTSPDMSKLYTEAFLPK
jgi:ABC-type nitrate/sulfonate/bicarbonate transport system substrate-binding protein